MKAPPTWNLIPRSPAEGGAPRDCPVFDPALRPEAQCRRKAQTEGKACSEGLNPRLRILADRPYKFDTLNITNPLKGGGKYEEA